MSRTPRCAGPAWSPVAEPACGTPVQGDRTPGTRRVLGDISNTAWGLSAPEARPRKRPLAELRTPARRSKAFSVYEDGTDVGSAARCASSPPQVRPKGHGASPAPARGLFGIEELCAECLGGDLPDVEGLPDPSEQHERLAATFGLEEQCGFDSPTALVASLHDRYEEHMGFSRAFEFRQWESDDEAAPSTGSSGLRDRDSCLSGNTPPYGVSMPPLDLSSSPSLSPGCMDVDGGALKNLGSSLDSDGEELAGR